MSSNNCGRVIQQPFRPSDLPMRIKGVLEQNRLDITFCNTADLQDIPFHISVRPDENVIVRNNRVNGVFGIEERSGTNPIKFGCPFDILISAGKDKFIIDINGKHFANFEHRCPIKNAEYFVLEAQNCKIVHFSVDFNEIKCEKINEINNFQVLC